MIENPIPWPNGAKCAAAFTLDMDADSILHLAHPERAHRMVAAQSALRYGPEIAVPRILKTFKTFGIRQTFFIPAWCIETYPGTVDLILADGHEIGHHGYYHEHPNELSRDEEHFWLRRGIEVIEKRTGQRPRGWRAPLYNFSIHSADLLAEEGFLYDASLMGDDVPYVLRSKTGDVIELPSHWGMDDWPQYMHSLEFSYTKQVRSPKQGWEVFFAEFEAMRRYGGLWVAVWHPFVSGRLARWSETERALERMLEQGDVWFAPLEEIARHVKGMVDAGRYVPRIQPMPIYGEPIHRITFVKKD